MKHLKIVSLSILFTALLFACKKDNDSKPAEFTMAGRWIGKIGQGSTEPDGFYVLNIKSNGVVERIGFTGDVSASGTWSLEGEVFTAVYTYPGSGGTVNVDGTVDKSQKKLTGTWENGGEEGTFYATRD